jgi:two-component system, OmpR family, sensor histidine kinase KdpD
VYRKIPRFAASLLLVAAIWGLAEASLASVAAVLGFNFYFLPPVGTFTIQEPQNQIVFVAFLVTAATASQLSARARRRTAEAEARRLEIQRLYDLVQTTMLTGNPRKTIREFVQKLSRSSNAAPPLSITATPTNSSAPARKPSPSPTTTCAPPPKSTTRPATSPATSPLRPCGSAAALSAHGPHRSPPHRAPGSRDRQPAGHLHREGPCPRRRHHAEAARQSEVLKAALLDALAHDIKTPLTSIKAAVTGLISSPGEPGRELLTIINEEADRLN